MSSTLHILNTATSYLHHFLFFISDTTSVFQVSPHTNSFLKQQSTEHTFNMYQNVCFYCSLTFFSQLSFSMVEWQGTNKNQTFWGTVWDGCGKSRCWCHVKVGICSVSGNWITMTGLPTMAPGHHWEVIVRVFIHQTGNPRVTYGAGWRRNL